jgi:hypothetical protein
MKMNIFSRKLAGNGGFQFQIRADSRLWGAEGKPTKRVS